MLWPEDDGHWECSTDSRFLKKMFLCMHPSKTKLLFSCLLAISGVLSIMYVDISTNEGALPSHLMSILLHLFNSVNRNNSPYVGHQFANSVVLENVLPHCDYKPLYVYKHKVLRYKGFLEVQYASVYPDDHTLCRNDWKWSNGNPLIDKERVQLVLDEYVYALKKSSYGDRFSELKLRILEENANVLDEIHDGWRYLFEADVYWKDREEPTTISEYVYSSETDPSRKLCSVQGHQWERKVKVHIIIPVKNQGKWVVHVVKNLENIYLKTGDTNFTLIIVDYESTDVNITRVFEESRLPKNMLKLIPLKGDFTRTISIQTGINSVENPNDIIMTVDLHLTIPTGFIQAIRKHTIKGRMGYGPTLVRLNEGHDEHDINGRWELLGYGLLSLYKSDWDAVGGMNTKEFTKKWGGEDWELIDRVQSNGYELFRHRYPGLVHYHHSHRGMWDSLNSAENPEE